MVSAGEEGARQLVSRLEPTCRQRAPHWVDPALKLDPARPATPTQALLVRLYRSVRTAGQQTVDCVPQPAVPGAGGGPVQLLGLAAPAPRPRPLGLGGLPALHCGLCRGRPPLAPPVLRTPATGAPPHPAGLYPSLQAFLQLLSSRGPTPVLIKFALAKAACTNTDNNNQYRRAPFYFVL